MGPPQPSRRLSSSPQRQQARTPLSFPWGLWVIVSGRCWGGGDRNSNSRDVAKCVQFCKRLRILAFDLEILNPPLTTGDAFEVGGCRGRAGFPGEPCGLGGGRLRAGTKHRRGGSGELRPPRSQRRSPERTRGLVLPSRFCSPPRSGIHPLGPERVLGRRERKCLPWVPPVTPLVGQALPSPGLAESRLWVGPL